MSWILYTLLMFLSSIFLYVFVRYSKKYDTSPAILNLSMFALPAVFFLIYILVTGIELKITLSQFAVIVVAALFFSFLGNLLSVKGIQQAPNPGFSLMIQKSYGAFTLFVAPIFFEAHITTIKVVGSFVVLAFGLLISIEKGKKLIDKNNYWLAHSMGAFFCFSFLVLTAKYLFLQQVGVIVYLFILFAVVSIISIIHNLLTNKLFKFDKSELVLLFFIGVFSFLFNIFMNLAIDTAPNVGYVNITNAGSIAALTIVSVLLFKDEINIQKAIGVLGVFFGMVLLFI